MIITWIDGSLGGAEGNTSKFVTPFLAHVTAAARARAEVRRVHLVTGEWRGERLERALAESDAFLFTTGTYWDSWGSPLQAFLEEATAFEGTDTLLGKPAAAVVTMHSVGGKEVLSRLQGVLSTMGLLIPPMSGMVYSLAAHMAMRSADPPYAEFREDFWQGRDLEVLAHNLLEAASGGRAWRRWPVDERDAGRGWFGRG